MGSSWWFNPTWRPRHWYSRLNYNIYSWKLSVLSNSRKRDLGTYRFCVRSGHGTSRGPTAYFVRLFSGFPSPAYRPPRTLDRHSRVSSPRCYHRDLIAAGNDLRDRDVINNWIESIPVKRRADALAVSAPSFTVTIISYHPWASRLQSRHSDLKKRIEKN